jgi:nucleoside-diphosphate-sugar epimerase
MEGCKTFEILGNGQQTRAFTYVDDIVNGLITLAESDLQNETVNLGSSEETRIFDLANMILRFVGVDTRRVEFVFRPGHPLDVQKRSASIERARRLLSWKPRIDLQTGLRKTIDWFDESRSKRIKSTVQGEC